MSLSLLKTQSATPYKQMSHKAEFFFHRDIRNICLYTQMTTTKSPINVDCSQFNCKVDISLPLMSHIIVEHLEGATTQCVCHIYNIIPASSCKIQKNLPPSISYTTNRCSYSGALLYPALIRRPLFNNTGATNNIPANIPTTNTKCMPPLKLGPINPKSDKLSTGSQTLSS